MAPPTIVFLHGFTQTGHSWDRVVAALGERYRALAPDLRGHGTAGDKRPVGFAEIEHDVLAQAPGRFTLAGYSMGGRIALDLALRDRGAAESSGGAAKPNGAAQPRIERLVLIGATPGLPDPAERAERRAADERLAQQLEADGVEAFARRWARQPLFSTQSPAVAAAAHAERVSNSPDGLAASLRGVGTGTMEPLWERLGELTMPVDLVVGALDGKFTAIAERMAERIPHATVHIVAGAGHAVQLERPDAVAELLEPGSPPTTPGPPGPAPSGRA